MPRRWAILFYTGVTLWGFLMGLLWFMASHLLTRSQQHIDYVVAQASRYMHDQFGDVGVLDWQRTLGHDPHLFYLTITAQHLQMMMGISTVWGLVILFLWRSALRATTNLQRQWQSEKESLAHSLHEWETEIQRLQTQSIHDQAFWSQLLNDVVKGDATPTYVFDDCQRLVATRVEAEQEFRGESWMEIPSLKMVGPTLAASFESPDIPICITLQETKTATFLARSYLHDRKAICIYVS